jgi:ankyrin repeat protein
MRGIYLTAWFGLTEMVGMLLEDGHDSDYKNSHGRTPLSWAAKNGYEGVVKLLLVARADVEAAFLHTQTDLS